MHLSRFFALRNPSFDKSVMSFNNTTTVQSASSTQPPSAVYIIMEPTWLTIVRLTIESTIALAGVIGNFLVCFAITRHRALSKFPTNTYIRNLATGDLASLLVSFPLGTVREQFAYWPLGEFTCRYIFPLSDIFFGVSVWSIAAIAVDRHRILAVDVPRPARSVFFPKIVCATIWFISFLAISLPLLLVFEHQHPPGTRPLCSANWPKPEFLLIYTIAMSLFTYVVPLSLIIVTYCTIKRKLFKIKRESLEMETMAQNGFRGKFNSGNVSSIKKRIERFNRIMTPVIVVFAITVLPLTIFRVAIMFYFNNPIFKKYSQVMLRICVVFYLFNLACNPLIYSIVSKRFRQSFREMLAWA